MHIFAIFLGIRFISSADILALAAATLMLVVLSIACAVSIETTAYG